MSYIATVFADYVSVREGRKPLVIVSSEKSALAYETVAELAEEDGLTYKLALLIGEDGDLHEHVLVTWRGAPFVHEALKYIDDARCGRIDRRTLQLRLGLLLGYRAAECLSFVNSEIGQTCPCDCCGGPRTVTTRTDRDAHHARTMEFGYRY